MYHQSIFSFLALVGLTRAAVLPLGVRSSCATSTLAIDANSTQCPNYCAGTLNNASLLATYVCGDTRLGPRVLPAGINVGTLLTTYHRFGGLCPGQYLQAWYNETAKSYIYPDFEGFQLNNGSTPISGTVKLAVGTLVDRFGQETGSFLSPEGAPYMQRSIPPSNLDAAVGSAYPYNYHVYNVTKAFDVLSGPIAPWFGQPGEGVQFETSSSIATLISTGYLARLNVTG